MRSVLRILVFVPLGLVFLYFAAANRAPVRIFLDPFPGAGESGPSFEAPLYLVVLASVALGVVAGGVSSFVAHGRYRRAAKVARADAKKARSEADQLRGQALASLSPAPGASNRSPRNDLG
ncbi:lipopolysaccharide assembly protein LapA domain-containing protein [Methylosinus sp. Ce-a6]|uniref:lipopolysaccharide assembly protein LapA domain-containing protein n=1 Tax=Methylosinus sp. Ce-a6 TaxID=2172005 RepID=UPI00135CED12|nr:LapA family protein [Methylosinus sp. Ce-a6]